MNADSIDKNEFSMMSIDVEDGLNLGMRNFFNIDIPPTERVVKNVNLILELFGEKNIKSTFFILGEIAKTYPGLIKSIANEGHEIGVHGFYHDPLFKLSKEQAKNDINKAKELIEAVAGVKVYGFRAPVFSISSNTAWALEIISELGFKYDSSIMPTHTKRYGWPGFPKEIIRLELSTGNSLIEVPLSVINLLCKTIPVCGGGYMRHMPYYVTRKAFSYLQEQRPVLVYLHPYEIDTERYPDYFYKYRTISNFKKWMPLIFYRLNKRSAKKKLRWLIDEFKFKPIIDIIEETEKQIKLPVKNL